MSLARQGKKIEFSKEHKINMSKPKIKAICPHCQKEGGLNLLKRYHFDNCKELKNR